MSTAVTGPQAIQAGFPVSQAGRTLACVLDSPLPCNCAYRDCPTKTLTLMLFSISVLLARVLSRTFTRGCDQPIRPQTVHRRPRLEQLTGSIVWPQRRPSRQVQQVDDSAS